MGWRLGYYLDLVRHRRLFYRRVVCRRRLFYRCLVLSRSIGAVHRRCLALSRSIGVYIGVMHLEDLVPRRTSSGTSSEVLGTSSEVLCTSGAFVGPRRRWYDAPWQRGIAHLRRWYDAPWERGIAHLNAHNCLHMGSCTQMGGNM